MLMKDERVRYGGGGDVVVVDEGRVTTKPKQKTFTFSYYNSPPQCILC